MRLVLGLPVYNAQNHITATLNNIKKQTYQDWKMVISDNYSSDETCSLITKIISNDKRFRLYQSEKNYGSLANFNKSYEMEPSDYFAWIPADDKHDKEFIESLLAYMLQNPNIVLCMSEAAIHDPIAEEVICHVNLRTFINCKSIRNRYRESLRNFPAVAMYGVFRSSALNKTKLFPHVMGGDLLLMQELSLYGDFAYVPKVLFTRLGRQFWNTTEQDYRTFLGKNKKPWYYSPFILVSFMQMKTLLFAKIGFLEKPILFFELFLFQVRSLFIKILLKLIRLLPLRQETKKTLGVKIYWKFMHNPNVLVLNEKRFLERIILPQIKIS